jgi:hypothetical protein
MMRNDIDLAPVDTVQESLESEHRRRLLLKFIQISQALGLSKREIDFMVRAIVRKHF